MSSKIPKILSIQSHIVYGYAGNKAAVFPMQKLGIEVSQYTQYSFQTILSMIFIKDLSLVLKISKMLSMVL